MKFLSCRKSTGLCKVAVAINHVERSYLRGKGPFLGFFELDFDRFVFHLASNKKARSNAGLQMNILNEVI